MEQHQGKKFGHREALSRCPQNILAVAFTDARLTVLGASTIQRYDRRNSSTAIWRAIPDTLDDTSCVLRYSSIHPTLAVRLVPPPARDCKSLSLATCPDFSFDPIYAKSLNPLSEQGVFLMTAVLGIKAAGIHYLNPFVLSSAPHRFTK